MLLALLAAATLAFAATAGLAATDCSDPQDQATMTICAGESFKAADDALNEKYREIERRLAADPAGLDRLRKAERAWVAFRDAECAFQSSGDDGGSVAPMIEAGCMERLTRDRLTAFDGYLACDEYDASCPAPAAD